MKKQNLVLIFIILITSFTGCKKDNKTSKTSEMKDTSVSYAGIEFSKSINDADKYYQVNDSQICIIGNEKTNYFISPDGSRYDATAPILLTTIDNKKPFTFITKIKSDIKHMYDAGTVYLYLNDDNWLKFAFERDEKERKRVVTVKTNRFSDDNNHDIIMEDYVYMKISSDTRQIGFYYSLDGTDWNLARLYRNEYPEKLWIGISSQSSRGSGNTAYFEEMSLLFDNINNFRLGE